MSISKEEHRKVCILSETIIGCAFRVYNELGFGFLESVYENCLSLELNLQGLKTLNQEPLRVMYKETCVGNFIADMIVEGRVVIELKSVLQLGKVHETQLVNYLNATGIDSGLLLNFGPNQVDIKRKYRIYGDRATPKLNSSKQSC